MFIRITTNSKGQGYYHLVESYRDQGKVRQRILLSLGKVGEDRLDDLISAISRHKDVLTALDAAKSLEIEDTYILGPLLILQHVFARFGIKPLLAKIARQHSQLQFNFERIVFTMIVCRFLKPGSKLKIFEHWQDKLYPEIISGKDELHHFYRTLDLLGQHQEQIEQDLYWHDRDLLNMSVDVVLYDLTTLRFESTREDLGELCRFGYSKEMRSDCTQVVWDYLSIPMVFLSDLRCTLGIHLRELLLLTSSNACVRNSKYGALFSWLIAGFFLRKIWSIFALIVGMKNRVNSLSG